jgi:hypothetical protein
VGDCTDGRSDGNTGRGISAGGNFKLTDFSVANNLGGGVALDAKSSLDPNGVCCDEVSSCNIFDNLQFGLMITNSSGNDSGDPASVAIRNVKLRNNVAEIINHAKARIRVEDGEVRGSINFTLGTNGFIRDSFLSSTTPCGLINADQGSIIEDSEFDGCSVQAGDDTIVKNCTVRNVCFGIKTGTNSLVDSCVVRNTTDDFGIRVSGNSIVRDCTVLECARNGIEITDRCQALRNNSSNNGKLIPTGAGIVCTNGPALIDGNLCDQSDEGIRTAGIGGATVIRNKATANTINYNFLAPGTDAAPVATAATATNPFSNF